PARRGRQAGAHPLARRCPDPSGEKHDDRDRRIVHRRDRDSPRGPTNPRERAGPPADGRDLRGIFWVAETDPCRPLYVSSAYETIWARPVADLERDPWSWLEAVHPDDRDNAAAAVKTCKVGKEAHAEFRIIRPDHSIRWVRAHTIPLKREDGTVYRLVGFVEDITALRAEEEAERFLSDASRAS